VKTYPGIGSILGGGAIALLAVQPVWAQTTEVTNVQLNQTDVGLELVLETENGDRPQIFTVNRGNSLTADIVNTQLNLPEGNGFVQNNPAPGISSIMVTQLDANSIRVTVSGETSAPLGQVAQSENNIVFTYLPAGAGTGEGAGAGTGTANNVPPGTPAAPPPMPTAPVAQQPPSPPPPTVPAPEVLVPDPNITVDGLPYQPTQPGSYTPPLLPRAIAPPLGDIAVSNIDPTPDRVTLGTNERVPRLVLRDAPVREVLSLLGRAANINVAYIDAAGEEADAEEATQGVTISLDIENEPVEDVFNYVIRIAGLEANRVGRTVFVSPRLPDSARSLIARTFRLNQVDSGSAAAYLATLGAETREFIPQQVTTVTERNDDTGIITTREEIVPASVNTVEVEAGESPILIGGLSVTSDPRLNSITVVGTPRQVEMASALLQQLDLRRRQVAINVKIVDVNLLATEDFNTSFSFGFDDGFFVTDGGAASFNYGGVNPPSSSDVGNSRLSPPITPAPFPEGIDLEPFLDAQPDAPFGTGDPQTFGNPPLNDGTIQIPNGTFFRPPFGTEGNPLQGGVTEVQEGNITIGLPTLFQYPTRFLAALQAQVVSGNAKILTDPTLVVQEGQVASVELAQQVITNITVNRDVTSAGVSETIELERSPAGLTLDIAVDRIDDNGFITLQVNPTVTSPTQTFDTGEGEIVLLSVRDVQSGLIRIRDGQTLILSGIIQETDRTTVSKVPILGDIPILGALFRSTERENTRQEVIVLLTPQILDDSDLSTFGYSYSPSQDVQDILRRQGVQAP
jgi:type IV pilus assembly protein PilQ